MFGKRKAVKKTKPADLSAEFKKLQEENISLKKELELHTWASQKTDTAIKSLYNELQKNKAEVEEAKNNLEIRVRERTAELTQANKQMSQEISERKRIQEELSESYEKLRKTMDGIVHSITTIIDSRDPYTAGHERRVAKLSVSVAEELGLDKYQIEGIFVAAMVHDIGKIYVPAEILSKPSHLTETEYILLKSHSQVGFDILKEIEFPWPIAQIVLQHHERMDGSGYPAGLSGENILLEARIIGVVDVVEAMASHRPYRPALGIDKALEEISQKKGILYDPKVVDACFRVISEKGFKFE